MTTSARYKFVKNTLGVPFTTNNFPSNNDGDDKKVRLVKRILTASDIGTAAGQVGHAQGAILDVVPSGSNVLMIEGSTYRRLDAVAGFIPISLLDNGEVGNGRADIAYALGTDNTIRLIDYAYVSDAAVAAGDIVMVRITIGSVTDSSDSMN